MIDKLYPATCRNRISDAHRTESAVIGAAVIGHDGRYRVGTGRAAGGERKSEKYGREGDPRIIYKAGEGRSRDPDYR